MQYLKYEWAFLFQLFHQLDYYQVFDAFLTQLERKIMVRRVVLKRLCDGVLLGSCPKYWLEFDLVSAPILTIGASSVGIRHGFDTDSRRSRD